MARRHKRMSAARGGKPKEQAMAQANRDIDEILEGWDFDPEVINARMVETADGRSVIQMRIEMGVVQMEAEHRPDGRRPHGAETYLDYLLYESIRVGEDFALTEEHREQLDREFAQFYQRRLCWLSLHEFARAVRDADHTLELMDFIETYGSGGSWVESHHRNRPLVLGHRTQAAALDELHNSSPESAIEEVNKGLDRIRSVLRAADCEHLYEDSDLVEQLRNLREWIRQQHGLGRTLTEQLAEAIQLEQYELAAQLRDQLKQQH